METMALISEDVRREIANRVIQLQDVTMAVYSKDLDGVKEVMLDYWITRNSSAPKGHVTLTFEDHYGEGRKTFHLKSKQALRSMLATCKWNGDLRDCDYQDHTLTYIFYMTGVSEPPKETDPIDEDTSMDMTVSCQKFKEFVKAAVSLVAEH